MKPAVYRLCMTWENGKKTTFGHFRKREEAERVIRAYKSFASANLEGRLIVVLEGQE